MPLPQPGDPAPEFEVLTAGPRPLSLADFRGQVLVLYFYPKADTAGCTREAQDFSALAEDFAALGAAIVGISPDPLKAAIRFRDKHRLQVTVASDEDHQAAEAYGVWAEKSMYGRKFMGVARSTFMIGRDSKILRSWPRVKVPGHAAEVLDAVRACCADAPSH